MGRARGLAAPAPMRDVPPTPLSAQSGDTARKIEIFSFEVTFICLISVLDIHSRRWRMWSRVYRKQEVRSQMSNKKCLNMFIVSQNSNCVKLTYVLNVILRNGIQKMSI